MKGGINRLRVKGGANPSTLYDLVNAYISNAGTIVPREGTILAETLDGTSVGLAAMSGLFNVFSNSLISVPGGYVDNVLVNPNNSADTLKTIWFAKPFMGFLYVVAEFTSGDVFHYWLQNNGTWIASTVYQTDNIVLPPTPNGLAYEAVRDMPINPTWGPLAAIALGDIVEPTDATGFAYVAVVVEGSSPHTSATEPTWPTTLGGTVQEYGDFDTNTGDSGTTSGTTAVTSGAQQLGSNITDKYGNSSDVASAGTASTINTTTLPVAAPTVTTWMPGTTYAPGAVVQPSTSQGAFTNAIPNGDFEAGNDGNWVLSAGTVTIDSTASAYQGNYCVEFAFTGSDNQECTMYNYGVVTPGQSVTATGYLDPNNNGANLSMQLLLVWYDDADTYISETVGATQQGFGYRQASVTGSAPANAAHVRVRIEAETGTHPNVGFADLITWNLETAAPVSNFLFEAIQAAAASSGSVEPTWPTVSGDTVVDNGVTWQAVATSIITWQAIPIMYSGTSAPTFPTTIGNTVNDPSTYTDQTGTSHDTSMSWIATARQITDVNCPNTTPVCLGASHVFDGNNDICGYSAAVNPTDWTTANNAGYLPTGLNNYGDNPIAVLALYRSNLMVFNAGGYQMWQIDPDPANMALLDAQPVGSIYTRAAQSVANDLVFLTEVGVRNIGTAGATANMQIGSSGQPVDKLVKAQLQAGTYYPISLYYPGRGQYWLIFGPQAFVFTINGQSGLRSWSRYVFPDTITDWTLNDGILYLRTAGNLVYQLDEDTLVDDAQSTSAPVTISEAAPAIVTWDAHDQYNGAAITFTTTGVLPAPLVVGTTYYVINESTNAFNLSLTQGGAAITTTTAGSGVHTATSIGVPFDGVIQWPYMDMGALGINKMLIGVDLVGTGEVIIQIAFNQGDATTFSDNSGFDASLNVTAPYLVAIADTVPGEPIPIPIEAPSYSLILTFPGNQAWEWDAANLYTNAAGGGGATG
jgi:hypothetical protein